MELSVQKLLDFVANFLYKKNTKAIFRLWIILVSRCSAKIRREAGLRGVSEVGFLTSTWWSETTIYFTSG